MNPDEPTRRKSWVATGAWEYWRECPYCEGTGVEEKSLFPCSHCDGDGMSWQLECEE